jgi:hypothetical protein
MGDLTKTLADVKASFSQYSTNELVAWRDYLKEYRSTPIHAKVLELLEKELARRKSPSPTT